MVSLKVKQMVRKAGVVQMEFWPSYLDNPKRKRWLRITPLELFELYFDKKMTYEQIGMKYNVPITEVCYAMRLFLDAANGKARKIEKVLPEKLSTDSPCFGYLLGVAYGDASLSGNAYTLKVTDKDFFDYVVRCLVDCGFLREELNISEMNSDMFTCPQNGKRYCSNKINYKLILYNKKFVDLIADFKLIELNGAQVIEFINGFCDSEGSVSSKKKYDYRIQISNTNKDIVDFVVRKLIGFGIRPKIYFQGRSVNISVISGRSFKDIYTIYVGGKENIIKFHRLFRFNIKRKQDRLDALVL